MIFTVQKWYNINTQIYTQEDCKHPKAKGSNLAKNASIGRIFSKKLRHQLTPSTHLDPPMKNLP